MLFLYSNNSCEIKSCIYSCGANFHYCKMEEHLMLCKKLPVSCINRINGCTVCIIREEMTDHLLKCPSMIASNVEYRQIANDTKGI